jgi:FAD/FMN-containing dehydrogenase
MVLGLSISSFGGVCAPSRRARDFSPSWISDARERGGEANLLAYGNGRSYGDSCLLADGTLLFMAGHRAILSFDAESGIIRAEAGATLADIIAVAAPHGWFLPVTPGTRHVTLGGAIANDVHGKNHHVRGTFGRHVEAMTLMRSDGSAHDLDRSDSTGLFAATIGGMGLTGVIADATIRLMKVPGLDIIETAKPFSDLDEYFSLAGEADRTFEYSVAWIDQCAQSRYAGRGVLLSGRHADDDRYRVRSAKAAITVPFTPPINLFSRPAVHLVSSAYRLAKSRSDTPKKVGYASYFYPLDGVGHWNRLYGRHGFFQHQSIVPEEAAPAAILLMLHRSRESGHASFLTVLKRFGNVRSPGIMSFPRPGYTLTLDFANYGARTLAMLAELDAIAVDAGGAVNPYKDARMSADTFMRSFPQWQTLERKRDPAFMSDFWLRTAMKSKQFLNKKETV